MAEILSLDVKGVSVPVVFENGGNLPVVFLRLCWREAGANQDGASALKSGLARLSAQMLNEGCLSLGSALFASECERKAVGINASVGREKLVIELDTLKEHYEFGLDKLKLILEEPNLIQSEFDKCKALSLGEISNYDNDNDYVVRTELFEQFFFGTPLANPSIGTAMSLQNLSLNDVRDFLASRLDLSNLYIVCGGDLSKQDVEKIALVIQNLPVGQSRDTQRFSPVRVPFESLSLKESEQAYINFASPFNVLNTQRHKARVASFILGESGFGSRIMEEVRVKRGLAYSAYARAVMGKSASYMYGYLQTKNESAKDAISVVRDEFDKFIKNGVKASELAQAKKFLQGSLPLSLETLFSRANVADGEFYEYGRLGEFLKEREMIASLELDELNEFIRSHSEINELSFAVLKNES